MGKMRAWAVVIAVLAALVAGCGGGDDEEPLTAEEQRYASAFARDLSDGDDGVATTAEQAQCIGQGILRVLSARPFHEAGIEPEDLEGDESPGQLLGAGTVSEAEADEIADRWLRCVDLAKDFVARARGLVELDASGRACFEEALRDSGLLHDYLTVSFTSADPADVLAVTTQITGLLADCAPEGVTSTTTAAAGDAATADRLAELLVQQYAVAPADARCLADGIISRVSAEDLQLMVTAGGPSGPTDAARVRVAEAMRAASGACDVALPGASTTTTGAR